MFSQTQRDSSLFNDDDFSLNINTTSSFTLTEDSITTSLLENDYEYIEEFDQKENDYTIDESNPCNKLLFNDLCSIYEKIRTIKNNDEKLSLIFNAKLYNQIKNASLYPLLRLLLPSSDYGYNNYNIRESTLAKFYIKSLCLTPGTEDFKLLKDWKDNLCNSFTYNKGENIVNKLNKYDKNTDSFEINSIEFSLVVEKILERRLRKNEKSYKTLGEINKILLSLTKIRNTNNDNKNSNTNEKYKIFHQNIIHSLSSNEQKWLIRIIFHNLRLGLHYKGVLNMLFRNAVKRFNECMNLRIICNYILALNKSPTNSSDNAVCIENGSSSTISTTPKSNALSLLTKSFGLKVFMPFFPMLSKGFSSSGVNQIFKVEECLNGEPFVMDLKLDGERILFHLNKKNQFQFYTRKGNNFTNIYSSLGYNVISCIRKKQDLNQFILSQTNSTSLTSSPFTPSYTSENNNNLSVILDGEVCSMNRETKLFLPFGTNRTVSKAENEFGVNFSKSDTTWYKRLNAWMIYVIFDILFLSGNNSEKLIELSILQCGFTVEEVLKMKSKHFQDYFTTGISSSSKGYAQPASFSRLSGDLTYLPLVVRRKLLESLIEPEQYRVEFTPCRYVLSQEKEERIKEIENYFHHVVLLGKREGLILKKLLSPYTLGEDSKYKGDWIKMKPEYGQLTEEIDLVLLGAYFSSSVNQENSRHHGVSQFLLGCLNDIDDIDENKSDGWNSISSTNNNNNVSTSKSKIPKFHTIARVGSGYSNKILDRIRILISSSSCYWSDLEKDTVPTHFSPWKPKAADIPHIYFNIDFDSLDIDGEIPSDNIKTNINSLDDNQYKTVDQFFDTISSYNRADKKIPLIVFTIRCAEIVPSNSFSSGLTCRFPRATKIRLDKSLKSICKTSEAKKMLKGFIKDFDPTPKTFSNTLLSSLSQASSDSPYRGNVLSLNGFVDSTFTLKSAGVELEIDNEISDKENHENDYDFDYENDDFNLELFNDKKLLEEENKDKINLIYEKEIDQIDPPQLLSEYHLNIFKKWHDNQLITIKKLELIKKNRNPLKSSKKRIYSNIDDSILLDADDEVDEKNDTIENKRLKINENEKIFLFFSPSLLFIEENYIYTDIRGSKKSYTKIELSNLLEDYGATIANKDSSNESYILTSDEK